MRVHRFHRTCREHGIGHRRTQPDHLWANGRVERMNRTIKEAIADRYHYASHGKLRQHLHLFANASKHRRRLRTLRSRYLARIRTQDPSTH